MDSASLSGGPSCAARFATAETTASSLDLAAEGGSLPHERGRSRLHLLQGDQGHGQQRGEDADRFPAGEVFVQNDSSQQRR